MQELKFPKSKLIFIFSAVGAVVFIFKGVELINATPIENYPNLKKNVGIVSILFWGALIVWNIWNLIKKPNGLILNQTGIINHSDQIQNSLVEWKHIEKIELLNNKGGGIIGVLPKEDAFEKNNQSKKQLKQTARNIKKYGFPILIHTKKINKKGEELLTAIFDYQQDLAGDTV